MGLTDALVQALINFGVQIPLLAVWAIGAILAIVYWRRDPRSAFLILFACLICIAEVIAFGILYAVLPQFLHGGMYFGGIGIRAFYSILGLVRSCVIAAAWVIVLVAMFRRRPAG